mmetsp:Transcript_8328/g.16607  ORF Transcript_8328/g.16607 Transcript_8328/m.16607 type:complete len:99 (-) Transcript_8328:565-861(-)
MGSFVDDLATLTPEVSMGGTIAREFVSSECKPEPKCPALRAELRPVSCECDAAAALPCASLRLLLSLCDGVAEEASLSSAIELELVLLLVAMWAILQV